MFGLGIHELILVLVIVVLVFGATRLPQLGDALGKGIKNFRRSVSGKDEIDVTPVSEERLEDCSTEGKRDQAAAQDQDQDQDQQNVNSASKGGHSGDGDDGEND